MNTLSMNHPKRRNASQADHSCQESQEWDDSLDSYVQIILSPTGVDLANDAVHIEKSAQFTLPPVNGNFQDMALGSLLLRRRMK